MTQEIPEKLFFKIGEVADIARVEQHVLRYWEEEFDSLNPDKTRTGQRLYQKKDVELILKIKKLLYDEKYTIAGAKKNLKNRSKIKQLNINYDPNEIIQFKKKIKHDLQSILKLLDL